MMNFVVISLVVASLIVAGVFSLNLEKNNQKPQVIIKEGCRVIVVEYDKHGKPNTKISISPKNEYYIKKPSSSSSSGVEEKISSTAFDTYNNAKDNIKEAFLVIGQGISGHSHGPRELLYDVYRNCKHKIANTIWKTKDKVKEVVTHGKKKASEAKENVSEVAHEKTTEVKDMVYKATHDVIAQNKKIAHEDKEVMQDALGKAKQGFSEKAHGVKEVVHETYGKVKKEVSQTTQEVKETVEKPVVKAKGIVKETKDLGKMIKRDITRKISEQVTNVHESIKEKAKEVKEHVDEMIKTSAHNFFDTFVHSDTFGGLMSVLNLLGFVIAYGMCVWVSFVSSYVFAESLPRQQFRMVQSKIYPVFFKGMTSSVMLALLGHMS